MGARHDVQFVLLIRRKEKAMNENIIEYIVRETSYPSAIKQEVIGVIVRCKDCKWWMAHPQWQAESGYCKDIYVAKKADDYCSYGAPKTAESE